MTLFRRRTTSLYEGTALVRRLECCCWREERERMEDRRGRVRLRVGLSCLGGLTGEEMDQYTGMPIGSGGESQLCLLLS